MLPGQAETLLPFPKPFVRAINNKADGGSRSKFKPKVYSSAAPRTDLEVSMLKNKLLGFNFAAMFPQETKRSKEGRQV